MRRSALTGQEWMQRYVRSRLLSNPGRDAGPMSSSAAPHKSFGGSLRHAVALWRARRSRGW